MYTISHITNNFWAQEWWQQNIFFSEIQEVGPLKLKKEEEECPCPCHGPCLSPSSLT
jgi:hypothetical protein